MIIRAGLELMWLLAKSNSLLELRKISLISLKKDFIMSCEIEELRVGQSKMRGSAKAGK